MEGFRRKLVIIRKVNFKRVKLKRPLGKIILLRKCSSQVENRKAREK